MMPDLTVLGKVIGGGLPAAAYAGPRELMERVAPAGDVYQAGTLSGNPLATAAGLATLSLLDAAAYEQLERHHPPPGRGPARAAAADAGRGRAGPLDHRPADRLLLRAPRSASFEDAQRCDREAHAAFCRALLERGVYPPPSQFEAWFPSLAHTDEHVDRTVEAAARGVRGVSTLRELAEAADPALAAHAVEDPGPGRFASVTNRTRGFVLEAVREAYELHYGTPRAFEELDEDLRLLGGDALYALGLSRLAEVGRPGGGGRAVRPDHRLRQGPGRRGAGDRGARLGGLRGAVGVIGLGTARAALVFF